MLIVVQAQLATHINVAGVLKWLGRICYRGRKAASSKERLGFPDGYEFGIAVLPGYAKEKTAPHEPDCSKISFID